MLVVILILVFPFYFSYARILSYISYIVSNLGARNADDVYTASLFITLKDHDNESLRQYVAKSQMRSVRAEAQKENIDLDSVVLKEGTYYSSTTLTTFYVSKNMDGKCATEMRGAMKSLKPFISIKFIDENGKSLSVLKFPLIELELLKIRHYFTIFYSQRCNGQNAPN